MVIAEVVARSISSEFERRKILLPIEKIVRFIDSGCLNVFDLRATDLFIDGESWESQVSGYQGIFWDWFEILGIFWDWIFCLSQRYSWQRRSFNGWRWSFVGTCRVFSIVTSLNSKSGVKEYCIGDLGWKLQTRCYRNPGSRQYQGKNYEYKLFVSRT